MIVDAHADLLWEIWKEASEEKRELLVDEAIAAMINQNVLLQVLPIFVPEEVAEERKWEVMLEMIGIAEQMIFSRPEVIRVLKAEDLPSVERKIELKMVAIMLAVEGADALNIHTEQRLQVLHSFGIRMIGFTWNHSNWFGDGAFGTLHGGLSAHGIEAVVVCEQLGIIIDGAHLSEKAFWDLLKHSALPIAITHSNSAHVYAHPRNLTNEQIHSVVERGGCIGLNFVPFLLFDTNSEELQSEIQCWMNHLMTMLDQNARLHIGFGSDFWGADRMIEGINGPNDWSRFLEMAKSEQLLSENDWIRIGSENWLTFFRKMMK